MLAAKTSTIYAVFLLSEVSILFLLFDIVNYRSAPLSQFDMMQISIETKEDSKLDWLKWLCSEGFRILFASHRVKKKDAKEIAVKLSACAIENHRMHRVVVCVDE